MVPRMEARKERERDLKKLKVKQAPRTHSHSYGRLTAAAAAAISLPVTASFLFPRDQPKWGSRRRTRSLDLSLLRYTYIPSFLFLPLVKAPLQLKEETNYVGI